MIYGAWKCIVLMQMLHAMKILNSAFSLFLYTYFPSSGIRALYHMIYMLNVLIIARVMIMHIDICKSCEYGD